MASPAHNIPSFGSLVPGVKRQLNGFDYEHHGEWKDPFFFVQVTDIQFGFDAKVHGGTGWSWEIDNANRFVKAVNKMNPQPKFVMLTGDLVHALPGEAEKEQQTKDFKAAFSKLDPSIPFLCIPGNHDIGDAPTAEDVQEYVAHFGEDYYSFWCGGVKFIAINTQYLKNSTQMPTQREEHDKWFEEELADGRDKAACRRVILFQHIPWFLAAPDEKDDRYFNITISDRTKWLDLMKKSGVSHAFSGHYHRNTGGLDGDFEMVVTSALGVQLGKDKPGFRVVRVDSDKVSHKYVDVDDAMSVIDLTSLTF